MYCPGRNYYGDEKFKNIASLVMMCLETDFLHQKEIKMSIKCECVYLLDCNKLRKRKMHRAG